MKKEQREAIEELAESYLHGNKEDVSRILRTQITTADCIALSFAVFIRLNLEGVGHNFVRSMMIDTDYD